MISKYVALLEAVGVFAMILLYIWRWRWAYPLSWLIILGLVLVSHALRRETPAELGFRLTNLKSALAAMAPVVLLLAAALLGIGAICSTIRPVTPGAGFSNLALYCLWGLFQQYLLNGYFRKSLCGDFPGHRSAAGGVSFLRHPHAELVPYGGDFVRRVCVRESISEVPKPLRARPGAWGPRVFTLPLCAGYNQSSSLCWSQVVRLNISSSCCWPADSSLLKNSI